VVAWLALVRTHRPKDQTVDLSVLERSAEDGPALPAWRRLVVVGVAVVTVGLWITEPLHGITPPVVAFVPVTVLAVSGVIQAADIRSLEWDVLLLLAGGLALGVAVSRTGLADYLVAALPLGTAGPLALAAALATLTAVLSNFMSNTATANIVVPMGIAFAPGAEAPVVVAIALSASAAMALPVSTPPNAIAFASGHLVNRDFVPFGVLIGVLATSLAVLWAALLLG
jgi:sodium-dependent dicarboxylate transporter 2/3/5